MENTENVHFIEKTDLFNIDFCSEFQKEQEVVLIPHKNDKVTSSPLVTQVEDKQHAEGLTGFEPACLY